MHLSVDTHGCPAHEQIDHVRYFFTTLPGRTLMTTKNTPPENAPTTGTYRHYKGNLYQVLGTAQHSETEEWMVVYQALYGDYGFWVRPLSIWLEPVSKGAAAKTSLHSDENDAQLSKNIPPRFEKVTPSSVSLTQLTKDLFN